MLPNAAVGSADWRLGRAFGRHWDRLNCVLRRTGIGSGDVEDVVQEAFCVLARRLDAVPERAERSFLIQTALRLASDRRRSVWHGIMSHDTCSDDWAAGVGDGPEALY